ncbi:MAG: extracellular solute-binding protein, partial [Clostridia bacterium]|nr:extracellular solute-binding protein [Clostridia bacterium]
MYINNTYVEALGYELPHVLTWDFVCEVADKAAEKAEDGTFLLNGQNVMIPFLYKSTDNMMIQMLRQKDAPYSSSDGQILLFNDETRAILETISQHVANGAFSTFKISSYPANFLNAGQCVFAVDSTAGATWMGSDAPLTDISRDKFTAFETAVRMIPQFDPAHPQMISQGPSVCVFNHGDPQEVLASWLFTQYLLSNDVQIAYAQTEGYVPVTSKAQQDSAYLDYIAREGEDNDEHYAVKIQASRLMTEHVSDTFVTPAFNGSASLRDAAGQLIESTVKSIRRKQTVDDAYFDKLYEDTIALYHLNQGDGAKGMDGKADLGPLPAMSRYLLIGLCVIWVLIGLYSLRSLLRERRKER